MLYSFMNLAVILQENMWILKQLFQKITLLAIPELFLIILSPIIRKIILAKCTHT